MTIFVVTFGVYSFQRNVDNPIAWLLIVNSVVALVISAVKKA